MLVMRCRSHPEWVRVALGCCGRVHERQILCAGDQGAEAISGNANINTVRAEKILGTWLTKIEDTVSIILDQQFSFHVVPYLNVYGSDVSASRFSQSEKSCQARMLSNVEVFRAERFPCRKNSCISGNTTGKDGWAS